MLVSLLTVEISLVYDLTFFMLTCFTFPNMSFTLSLNPLNIIQFLKNLEPYFQFCHQVTCFLNLPLSSRTRSCKDKA